MMASRAKRYADLSQQSAITSQGTWDKVTARKRVTKRLEQ
jgi:hypothetical protein